MYRVIKIGHQWYGLKVDTFEDDWENLDSFVQENGDVVLLCDELEDLSEYIDIDDIEIVE